MLTFDQYVTTSRTHQLARHAFTLMVQHGYNPVKFVEWYKEEGQYLSEGLGTALGGAAGHLAALPVNIGKGIAHGTQQAIHNFGRAADYGPGDIKWSRAHGGWYHVKTNVPVPSDTNGKPIPQPHLEPAGQQMIADALAKLGELQGRKWIHEENPQLQSTLQYLIQNLTRLQKSADNYDKTQGSGPANAPTLNPTTWRKSTHPTPPPVNNVQPSQAPLQQTWFVPLGRTLAEHNQIMIERVLKKCVRAGIDPQDFADWYITEGQYCTSREMFEGRFGDWLGAVGKGISNWWNNGKFGDGYKGHYDMLKSTSLNNAKHALQTLKQNIPNLGGTDFAANLDTAIAELDKMSQSPQAQEPDQEAPAEAPAATPGFTYDPAASDPGLPTGTTALDPTKMNELATKLKNAITYGGTPGYLADPDIKEYLDDPGFRDEVTKIATDPGPDDTAKIAGISAIIQKYLNLKAHATSAAPVATVVPSGSTASSASSAGAAGSMPAHSMSKESYNPGGLVTFMEYARQRSGR